MAQMKLLVVLLLVVVGCATPAPSDRDNWTGTFTVEAELVEAAIAATDEWRRATNGRVDWTVVATEDDLTAYADWTLSTVPVRPAGKSKGWRGRAAGNAAIVLAGLSYADQYKVLLHELGHVAGLGHVDNTTMCAKLSCMPDYVDAATVAALDSVP